MFLVFEYLSVQPSLSAPAYLEHCVQTPNILFEKSEVLVLDMQNSTVASRVNLQRHAPSLGAFFVSLPQRRPRFSKNVAHSSSNSPHVIGNFSSQSWANFPPCCASLPLASLLYAAYCPRRVYFSLYSVKLSPKGYKVFIILPPQTQQLPIPHCEVSGVVFRL